jgi:hypothetical protein
LLNLLLNENMKIYRRLRTWILVAVVIVITTTMLIIIHNTNKVPQANGDWKTTIQHQIDNNKILFEQTKLPSDKVELKAKLNVDQYRLEHNKPPTDRSLWGGILNAVSLISLVTIFTVVIAADLWVAHRFPHCASHRNKHDRFSWDGHCANPYYGETSDRAVSDVHIVKIGMPVARIVSKSNKRRDLE